MMSTTHSDLVDLTLQLHANTERAILVSSDGDREAAVWLAKSLIEFEPKAGGIVEVQCPEWLATERGLV